MQERRPPIFLEDCLEDFMEKTCKDCAHFIGCGDWDLCCTETHEGYPFGFLCYEDTPACKKFEEKNKSGCADRK